MGEVGVFVHVHASIINTGNNATVSYKWCYLKPNYKYCLLKYTITSRLTGVLRLLKSGLHFFR